jgi:zona occludens toxin (predicted ATPase)
MSKRYGTSLRRQVSAQPEVFRAADELAKDAGHNSFSRIVQDLIVDAAIRLYGPKWRNEIEEEEKAERAA